jgi:hypothetical protein
MRDNPCPLRDLTRHLPNTKRKIYRLFFRILLFPFFLSLYIWLYVLYASVNCVNDVFLSLCLCILIVTFMYFYCYVYSVLGILFHCVVLRIVFV